MSDLSERIAQLPPEKRKALFEKLGKKRGGTLVDSIPKVPRDKNAFPLSFSQERIWFLEQLDPGSSAFNIPLNLRFDGPFDPDVFRQALDNVTQRHESLRTTFGTNEGQPVQVVSEKSQVSYSFRDLSSMPVEEMEIEVDRLVYQEARLPFDIQQGPLCRATLLRLHETVHGLLLTMHHIISDGQSLQVLVGDLLACYTALSEQKPIPLPELPIQFADFAVWQRNWLQGEVLEELLDYWKPALAGAPATLALPTDRPRPPVQTFAGENFTLRLSSELSVAVREFAKQKGATLFMVVLAVFKVLLYRYTGQPDVVVGTPVGGRNRSETEDLVGCFINNLVLRTDLGGTPTFLELLERVRKVVLGATSHSELPFEYLVEQLQPERNLSASPFFQVMLIHLNAPNQEVEVSELRVNPLLENTGTSKYDLTVYLEEAGDKLIAGFEYNTDLFEASTIQRLAAHLETLMQAVVAHPEKAISELPLLNEEETRRILVERNQTAAALDGPHCFHHLFEKQVLDRPQAVAVEFGGDTLTYGGLNERANRLANYLRGHGVAPDVLVGLCVERSLSMMVALLGILKAGGAYVPLDPSYPEERIAYMLQDAGASVLVTEEPLLTRLPETNADTICLDRDWPEISACSADNPLSEVCGDYLAYVIYTSGSTGRPKGVAVRHRSLVNFLQSMAERPGLGSEDVLLAVTTLSFDIAALELYLPLACGAKVVLASRDTASDARQLRELMQSCSATVMQATPATWRMLIDSGWEGHEKLKVLAGGEALPPELAGQLLPACKSLWNMYGPTETTIWSLVQPVVDAGNLIPIGKPIANTTVYLLDGSLQPVPEGVFGEIYIGGDGLARGYLHHPELTAERFLPDPFSERPGARIYRTGDLARYLEDGTIEFAGRIDHQVKIRGFRIELGEIEAILEQHPSVQQAAVTPKEMAQGDVRLVAYVIYTSHDEPTVSELRKFLRAKLPDYMLPSIFVTLQALPLTPNGKVDRKNLPVPAGMRAEVSEGFEAPATDMETFIASVWEELLGIRGVSVHDNFFDLGGHSLLSMKVIYRIEERFGLHVNPREVIFKNLRQLAEFCEQELAGEKPAGDGRARRFLDKFRKSRAKVS